MSRVCGRYFVRQPLFPLADLTHTLVGRVDERWKGVSFYVQPRKEETITTIMFDAYRVWANTRKSYILLPTEFCTYIYCVCVHAITSQCVQNSVYGWSWNNGNNRLRTCADSHVVACPPRPVPQSTPALTLEDNTNSWHCAQYS